MTNQNLSNLEKAILGILTKNPSSSKEEITKLISLTNSNGCKFVSLKNYQSDKTNNTETANHVVNIGIIYANMLPKDETSLVNFDIETVNIESFNYDSIDLNGVALTDYKNMVKQALPLALKEMTDPKKDKDTSADIWLNKSLVYNLNTGSLSIFGQGITKETTIKGDYKKVKSAPKTIAKELIKRTANLRTNTLRRFKIENLTTVNIKGETVEL